MVKIDTKNNLVEESQAIVDKAQFRHSSNLIIGLHKKKLFGQISLTCLKATFSCNIELFDYLTSVNCNSNSAIEVGTDSN